MKQDFLQGFIAEQDAQIIIKRNAVLTCPTPPATTKVSAEGRSNYATLEPNASAGYGMTGLMAMQTWQSSCYGEVRPGYIFLFPGIYNSNPPAYQGTVSINCMAHAPLTGSGNTLHGEMCALLNRPEKDFIGFACKYPFDAPGNMGYNSGTCNPFWFNSREIPKDCNGVDWQAIVFNTLKQWLPGNPA